MIKQRRGGERQVALFLLGVVLLVPPVLLVFNHPTRVLGIPSLYLYIFTVWSGLIGLTVLIAQRIRREDFGGRDASVDAAGSASAQSSNMAANTEAMPDA